MSDGAPPKDPFLVSDLEVRIFRLLLAAASSGRLELRTGTFKSERVSFLCVVADEVRHPIATILRPEDAKHIRDAELAPARQPEGTPK